MARKRLSAIEYTVLGIAWKRGPCTTYALMKELASSTSTYYKARAGTAYPMVDRMLNSGLLSHAGHTGPKGEKLVELTASGVAALNEWLTTQPELTEVAHTVDFIRLRMFYMGAVPPAARDRFFEDVLAELSSHLAQCELAVERYTTMGDTFSVLATEGVIAETQARIEWLGSIRARATSEPLGKPGNAS